MVNEMVHCMVRLLIVYYLVGIVGTVVSKGQA